MKTKGRVVVVGAGMAGLTAAHFLKEAGYEVVVVERDSRPGGRIMTIERNGETLDVGAQFIHTNYALTLELARKFNLESDLAEMQSADMMIRDGRIHIIPWGSVRVPAISICSQIKMARLFLPMLARRKQLALESWPKLVDLDKIELSTYTRLKLNEECLTYMVRALMLTYSMSEPEGISLAYFLRSLYMYVTTGAHCFRSGNDALPKAMARNLDIRFGTVVEGILGDGVVRGVRTSQGDVEAAAVIAAVPSPALLPLYAEWSAEQRDFLEHFAYSKLPLVLYEGEIPNPIKYWGGLFDREAGHRISFVTFPHMKYDRACQPRYLLAWPLGTFGEELIDLPEAAIMQAVTADLRRALPAEAASLQPVSVFKHLHTYPQYRVGAFEKLLRFKATEGKPQGLYFAGDYTDGGLIEGAAQSGYKAVQRLMVD
jgi:oxygen-dependent protoporphyrinogen oxidase